MIKLLIADDEQIVLDSLKFIIENNCHDVDVIGFAKSGREAIEKADALRPDVIFMDIRMPGIDGIEAIKRIKEIHNDIEFVIITAYDYFNYAKEAIKLDVVDYLLKPMNKNKVIDTVLKVKKIVESKRENMIRELEMKEKMITILPHLESEMIYSLASATFRQENIDFYGSIFDMNLNIGYALVVLFEKDDNESHLDNLAGNVKMHETFMYLKEFIKNLRPCLAGILLDRIIVFVPVESDEDLFTIKNTSIDFAEKILKETHGKESSVRIGIGRPYQTSYFSKSYNEADFAAKMGIDCITHFDDIKLSDKEELILSNDDEELINNIVSNNIDTALIKVNSIFQKLLLHYNDDMDLLKSKVFSLSIEIIARINSYCDVTSVFEENLIIEILRTNEFESLKKIFSRFVSNIILKLHKNRERYYTGLIAKAIEFVNENYDKDIKLYDVAKMLNISYHYFSKTFKEETKCNFVDYITQVRINKAKEFLSKDSMSIKEVCFKVGYSDPNYFSRIFRKETGMTPTEYKSKNSEGGVAFEC
ncbi:response regulator [Thermoanaerobacterium thermosaccharolyticum]|uniref:response regulator n=1 Tax=Thermoanaerobacterium thermosaccharolyticum TaxID=1517 RepID=UPI003DA7EDCC